MLWRRKTLFEDHNFVIFRDIAKILFFLLAKQDICAVEKQGTRWMGQPYHIGGFL